MPDVVYLGRVKWIHENPEKNYRHATVEPLLQSYEDQKRWAGAIEDPVGEFPARGSIYWHNAPKGLEIGDIRQFEVEPHPFYKGELDKDAFQVSNHKYPMEIIDLRDIGSERDIRILLTTTGVFLNDQPLIERCVLWVQDEKWVGPVNMIRRSGTSSWVLSPTQRLDSIRCTKIPLGAIQQVELDGTRRILAPNQENLGQHIGFVTWEADEVLAKRVLSRLLKRDRKTAEALKITKEIFKTSIETIETAGLVGSHLAQELAFHERVKEILDVILMNEALLDEAADVCFAISPVKEKIEEKAEEDYQKKLTEHKNRLDEDLATKSADLEKIVGNLSAKEKELSSVEEQVQALEKELKERTLGFEKELEDRLRDLAEKPERLFAEMAVAKALVPRAGSSPITPRIAVRRPIDIPDSAIPIVNDPSTFMGSFYTQLLGSGISPVVGQGLHSTFISGLFPVLIGPEAYDVVSAYANCVSGGILHWIPVGGSIFEPSDLIARFDSISRCLVPHPGGLLDLLLDESDAMHIVVLDGFNRAAVDGYLIPLLLSAQDVVQGKKPRSIPLAPYGFITEDDAYAGVCRIAWSRNVLLVLCPSIGVSTLPLPAEFWAHCTVLEVGEPAPEEVTPEPESTSRLTKVPAFVWKTWSEENKKQSTPLELLKEQLKEAGTLPPAIHNNINRLCRTGTVLGLKHEKALEQAVRLSLFPYLVAAEEDVEAWFKHIQVSFNQADRKIGATIRRLGE